MNLLLDTHALLWWLAGAGLSGEASERIADPSTRVSVSAATAWEIAIKQAIGKLSFKGEVAEVVNHGGFVPLAVSLEHAERAGALPLHHRDPFDRMLIAQAQLEGLAIVTRDPRFAAYDITVLGC